METIEKNHSILRIGKTGENAFRTFSFNVSKWMAEYPHGEPIALFGSLMISWVMGMVMTIIVFAIGKWTKKMYATQPVGPEPD